MENHALDDFRRIIVRVYYPAADSHKGKKRTCYRDDYPRPYYRITRKHLRLKNDCFIDTTVDTRTHSIVEAEAVDMERRDSV